MRVSRPGYQQVVSSVPFYLIREAKSSFRKVVILLYLGVEQGPKEQFNTAVFTNLTSKRLAFLRVRVPLHVSQSKIF